MKPKIYLASRFSCQADMRAIRDRLVGLGYQVTSTWIDRGDDHLEESVARDLDAHPEHGRQFAEDDIHDLLAADILVSFTPPSGGGRGGRHVEFGFAMGAGKSVAVVGPRENVFHTLATHFPDVESWISSL